MEIAVSLYILITPLASEYGPVHPCRSTDIRDAKVDIDSAAQNVAFHHSLTLLHSYEIILHSVTLVCRNN
uniref:Uncharacterized protein n=1 Tax=Anopheles albimanus TaxID=7167 RepID=A0A182FYL1_ANOAL